jgi:DNA-binding beta-propeller fold protein YncE
MTTVGSGLYQYRVIEDWAKLPEGWQFGILVGVAVDSKDRVYVCHQRQDPPIVVFDRQGSYLCSWGTDEINEGHIMSIAPDDSMYLVDRGAHQALRLKLDGERLMELGRKGYPSDTGLTVIGGEPRRAAGPFNMPTRMFCAPSGDIYVSDGYRNARIHRFSAGGELISSWGVPGKNAPGEFYLPHSLWVDSQGLVYVCDRKNNRVQIFSPEGEFVSQWAGLTSPVDICMDGDENVFLHEGGTDEESPRITVLDKAGNMQARWDTPYGHQIWVDTHGDIYMAVCWEQRIQKFIRQG